MQSNFSWLALKASFFLIILVIISFTSGELPSRGDALDETNWRSGRQVKAAAVKRPQKQTTKSTQKPIPKSPQKPIPKSPQKPIAKIPQKSITKSPQKPTTKKPLTPIPNKALTPTTTNEDPEGLSQRSKWTIKGRQYG